MAKIKIEIVTRQSAGPFRNMNPGETCVHDIGGDGNFLVLGVKNKDTREFQTLLMTGVVNGIRVLEFTPPGSDTLQPFIPRVEHQQARSDAALFEKLDASVDLVFGDTVALPHPVVLPIESRPVEAEIKSRSGKP